MNTTRNTKIARQAIKDSAIAYLKDNYGATVEEYKGWTFVTYTTFYGAKKVYGLKMYKGTSCKPYSASYYSEAARDEKYAYFQKQADADFEYNQKKLAEKKAIQNNLQIGDILNTCWGYEQTNVEFYQVIDKKGCFVWVRELEQSYESSGGSDMSARVSPVPNSFKTGAEVLRKKICAGGYLKILSCAIASLWDGKPQYKSWYG